MRKGTEREDRERWREEGRRESKDRETTGLRESAEKAPAPTEQEPGLGVTSFSTIQPHEAWRYKVPCQGQL